MPDLLTVPEVAAILRMDEAYVRDQLSKRKGFPTAYRIGGRSLRWRGFPGGLMVIFLVPEVGSEQRGVAPVSAGPA